MNIKKSLICICMSLCLLFTCLPIQCSAADSNTSDESNINTENQKKILLIGNSFTYYNNKKMGIEPILKSMSTANNENLYIKAITNDGAYLSYYTDLIATYHEYHEAVMQALMEQQWDYILLQENTTAPYQYYESQMEPSVGKLLDYINEYQEEAKVLMYFTAPYDVTTLALSAHDLEMHTAYAMSRLKNKYGIEVLPIGMNAVHFSRMYSDVSVVYTDNKHPSYAGYYIAAATIFNRIYGRVPQNTASQLKKCTLTDAQIVELNDAIDDGVMNISSTKCDMSEYQSYQLSVTGNHGYVTWYSLDNEIATVSADGVVTAQMPGKTAIVCEDEAGYMDACEISVAEAVVKNLTFSRSSYLVGMGDRVCLMPQEATHIPTGYLVWKTSDNSVAKVSNTGMVSAIKPGTVKITVSSRLNAAIQASYLLCIQCIKTTELVHNITSVNDKTATVQLSWKKSLGAKTYNVYRSTAASGTYSKIGTATTNSYTDATALVGTNYYYKVTAVAGDASTEGPLSGSVRAFAPAKITDGTLEAGKKAYTLKWKKLTNVDGYEVYRTKKKNGKYVLVKTIKSKKTVKYTDKDVKVLLEKNAKNEAKAKKKSSKKKTPAYTPATYYYKVRAYKIINGVTYYGAYSDVICIKEEKASNNKKSTSKK